MNTTSNLIALGTITRREVDAHPAHLDADAAAVGDHDDAVLRDLRAHGRPRIGDIVPGIGYIDYIVPGLIMMAVITNCYGNISSSFFGAKFSATSRKCWSRRCRAG